MSAEPPWLPFDVVLAWSQEARQRGLADSGWAAFLDAWRRVDGDPERLPVSWRTRRRAFLARQEAARQRAQEPLWEKQRGSPSRRHLALVMWAFSPVPERVAEQAPGRPRPPLEERLPEH